MNKPLHIFSFLPLHSLISILLLLVFATCGYTSELTNEQVMGLVTKTAADIEKDSASTFEKINNGEHPYKDKEHATLYVFVYNTDIESVAHFKPTVRGKSYKDKPDIKGKLFRNEIVEGALKNGTGWVDYHYENPKTKAIEQKTTYYQLVTGSDGQQYIVCSGKYTD